jgi:hypothetical protein
VKKFEIGDAVIYVPLHAHGDLTHPDVEHGVVTSTNSAGTIFVRFAGDINSKGCDAEDLRHDQ